MTVPTTQGSRQKQTPLPTSLHGVRAGHKSGGSAGEIRWKLIVTEVGALLRLRASREVRYGGHLTYQR
jgi:hypothetical protein